MPLPSPPELMLTADVLVRRRLELFPLPGLEGLLHSAVGTDINHHAVIFEQGHRPAAQPGAEQCIDTCLGQELRGQPRAA